jgi:hypothetical protein
MGSCKCGSQEGCRAFPSTFACPSTTGRRQEGRRVCSGAFREVYAVSFSSPDTTSERHREARRAIFVKVYRGKHPASRGCKASAHGAKRRYTGTIDYQWEWQRLEIPTHGCRHSSDYAEQARRYGRRRPSLTSSWATLRRNCKRLTQDQRRSNASSELYFYESSPDETAPTFSAPPQRCGGTAIAVRCRTNATANRTKPDCFCTRTTRNSEAVHSQERRTSRSTTYTH